MRILFVIESLAVGGAEKSLVTLLNNMNIHDAQIDLLLFSNETSFEKYLPSHINIIRVTLRYTIVTRIIYLFLRKMSGKKQTHNIFWRVFSRQIKSISDEYDFAIAYGQGFCTYFVADKLKATIKYAWVNTDYRKAGHDMALDFTFYKKFRKIIAVSPDVKKGLLSALEKIGEKLDVEIIQDLTDAQMINDMALENMPCVMDDSKLKILTVCRLVKLKGLDHAIAAAQILKDKNIEFNWYIVGEGEQRQHLTSSIAKLNLVDKVHFLGEYSNPYPYMKACDIYVQTSLFEGLCLTLIEAASLNKPIVSTNFPTVYGIIKDGETGLIAEMNAESIAENIQMLIEDAQLRERIIHNLERHEHRDKDESLRKIQSLLLR